MIHVSAATGSIGFAFTYTSRRVKLCKKNGSRKGAILYHFTVPVLLF